GIGHHPAGHERCQRAHGGAVQAAGQRCRTVGRRMTSVVIKGGTVVDPRGASVCIVSPGFVDLHVHLREPGREEAETVETGSRAAARGGFTAIVAMPNTEPAIDCGAAVPPELD